MEVLTRAFTRSSNNHRARGLRSIPRAVAMVEHTDEDGATVFRHACTLGLEGIVSKRLTTPYRSGPSRDWPGNGAASGGTMVNDNRFQLPGEAARDGLRRLETQAVRVQTGPQRGTAWRLR